MSIIAKNDKELHTFIMKQLEQTAAEIGEAIKELWSEYIESRFYDMHPYEPFPKAYKRTYQLLESVVTVKPVISGNTATVKIFMDKDTASRGYEYDDVLIVWDLAARGYHGDESEEMQTEGRFFDELLADLNSGTLFSEFEKLLKSKGFSIEKSA